MREPDRLAERLMGMALRVRPLVLVGALAVTACGGGADDAAPPVTAVSSTADGASEPTDDSVPPTIADEPIPSLERCDAVPKRTTDVVNRLDAAGQQAVLDAVFSLWEEEGPESEFGGTWVDRDALGTLVVAVTDDPAPHRAAIAALLGGSTEGFDVVQVEFSQRRLTDATSIAFEAARNLGLEIEGVARDEPRNRVRVESLVPVSDAKLAAFAVALVDAGVEPLEMVCVQAPAPAEMPPVIEPGTTLDVDVAEDGDWLHATIVSCLGVTFPLSVLADLAPFTDADAALSEAARPYLGGESWAPELWRYASLDADAVILFGITTGVSIHTFALGPNGWIWTDGVSGGICDLEATLPDGLNVVDWELDPDVAPPGADATEIAVLATERACASGEPVGDRLLGPQVVETDTAVLITFAAITQLQGQNCPSHPPTPVTVELDAPLGDRTIRDGLLIGPITDIVEPAG